MTLVEFSAKCGKAALNLETKYLFNPAVALAVASWESAYGTSKLSVSDNNYFGIKAGSKSPHWSGKSRPAPDGGSYRIYDTIDQSFLDFGYLMTTNSRYIETAKLSYQVEQFSAAFINTGYMSGNKENYRLSINSRAPQFAKAINQLPILPDNTTLLIVGLILLVIFLMFILN